MDDGRIDTFSRIPALGLSRRSVLSALGASGAAGLLATMGYQARAEECPATTPEENLAVVRRFFEDGINTGNLDVFDEVVAPDIVYAGATVSDDSGVAALKRIYGEALTGLPGIQYTLVASVASGDAVAVRYAVEGVHNGVFRGLEPTGNIITWNHSAFTHVECGKITEMWAEVNQLDRLRQFGTIAEGGPAPLMAGASSAPAATPQAASESASCAEQSPEEVLAVADRLRADVYNAGNTDALPEIAAEGYLHGSANGPDVFGLEEGAKRIAAYQAALPDLDWTFDEAIAQGNRAAARWTVRGTHDGDLLGFAPTGTPVEFTGISFYTVECGKITEFEVEMDVVGLLEQIGAPVTREQ
jgi:steroid delta-isomerase-like uncharacterized protein